MVVTRRQQWKQENPDWSGMKCGKLFLEFHRLTIDKITEVYFSSTEGPLYSQSQCEKQGIQLTSSLQCANCVWDAVTWECSFKSLFWKTWCPASALSPSLPFGGGGDEHNRWFFHSPCFAGGFWRLFFVLTLLTPAPAGFLPPTPIIYRRHISMSKIFPESWPLFLPHSALLLWLTLTPSSPVQFRSSNAKEQNMLQKLKPTEKASFFLCRIGAV